MKMTRDQSARISLSRQSKQEHLKRTEIRVWQLLTLPPSSPYFRQREHCRLSSTSGGGESSGLSSWLLSEPQSKWKELIPNKEYEEETMGNNRHSCKGQSSKSFFKRSSLSNDSKDLGRGKCQSPKARLLGELPTEKRRLNFSLDKGEAGRCSGIGEFGSPGPLGFGAGIIFFIREGCC